MRIEARVAASGRRADSGKTEGVALTEEVVKEQKQTERYKRAGETWQAKQKELFENQVGNGERAIACVGGGGEVQNTGARHVGKETRDDMRPGGGD